MKKIFAIFALAFLLTGSVALASDKIDSCGDDHAIYNESGRFIESCIPEVEWDRVKNTPIFGTPDLIRVMRGQSIMMSNGIKDTCPTWYFTDCVIKPSLFAYFI